MKMERPVKNLLVDLDGTLLGNRSLSLSADFLRKAYELLKERIGFRQALKLFVSVQKELSRPSKDLTLDLRALELFARGLGMTLEESRKFVRESLLTFFPTLEKHFFPIEGAKDFLDWAKDRYPLTLATNPVWPKEIVELRVRWAGVDPSIFRQITYAKTMHACKPSPEYYQEILTQQGLEPEDCLLIGNEVKMDLPAARIGIPVFIVSPSKKLAPLTLKGARAPAWKGTYAHLRQLLETSSPETAIKATPRSTTPPQT